MHWYLTRIVPQLTVSKQFIPNPTLNTVAKVSLRWAVHVGTLLPFRIGVIFFALSTLKHLSIKKGIEGLCANYVDGIKAAYCFWPFVLVGLYALVPRRYGNLYFDSFNLIWAVTLSYIANRDHHDESNDSNLMDHHPAQKV